MRVVVDFVCCVRACAGVVAGSYSGSLGLGGGSEDSLM